MKNEYDEYKCVIELGKCRVCRKARADLIYYYQNTNSNGVKMCRKCANKKMANVS